MNTPNSPLRGPRQLGLSLVELMVALAIGSVLIAGAVTVYSKSRRSYGENEAVARLEETARFAMSVVELDVRMANNYGLVKGSAGIAGSARQDVAVPLSPMAGTVPLNVCGWNFTADLGTPVQADNDRYVLSLNNTRTAACDTLATPEGTAWTTTPVATADTLTVRRASAVQGGNAALQVCTTRVGGTLQPGGAGCAAAPAGWLGDLIVNAYYVDRNSQQQAGLPSLRRKTLTTIGGVAQYRDQEVIAGVEDMQVQLGIDTTGTGGTATQYIDPVNPLPANSQVVAVRIWLLVRGDAGEAGFTDSRTYQYGNRLAANGTTGDLNAVGGAGFAYQPSANPDGSFNGPQHVRRLLVSRTIMLRNAQGT